MPTLAVFTVKKFRYVNGTYWTNDGFGDYIRSLIPHFDRIILACHPRRGGVAPTGWYPLEHPRLEYHWLPYYEKENGCLLKLASMFWRCRRPALEADIVNVRVPDYTGICGGFWARHFKKPVFINHVDDWHSKIKEPATRLRGVWRLGLQAHFALYCALEKRLCARHLLFAQGRYAAGLYADNPQVHCCVSTSHAKKDISAGRDTCDDPAVCRLLAVGRLVHLKGHTVLMHAITLLRKRYPSRRFELTIVGEGPDLHAHRVLAERLGIDNCLKLVGQVDRSEIFRFYDEADIFCLPSLSEGTPKVILEAMARATPVIATNVGGVSTVVQHAQTGLLIAPNSAEAIVAAVARFIEDGKLRRKCIAGGLVVANRLTVESEWGRMVRIVRATFPQTWAGSQEVR